MKIFLLGRDSSVTNTLCDMLGSRQDWDTSIDLSWDDSKNKNLPEALTSTSYDLLIVNLEDFFSTPVDLVKKIITHLPSVPLLVIHSYNDELLINPLIKAGAKGYLQNGIPEEKLYESVVAVANGQQSVIAEST